MSSVGDPFVSSSSSSSISFVSFFSFHDLSTDLFRFRIDFQMMIPRTYDIVPWMGDQTVLEFCDLFFILIIILS
jgi:hypothetical protein